MDVQRLMKEEKDKLLKKWSPFLEGISDEYVVENTAILLENEAKYLTEAPGSTTQGDVQGLQKIMLPIVRRVFPNLIANNIVSVQPIAAPAGIIFYLKYQYGTEKPGNPASGYTGQDYPEYSMYEEVAGAQEGYNPYYSTDEIGPFSGTVDNAISVNPLVKPPRTYNGTVDGSGKTEIQNVWPMQATVGAVNVDPSAILVGTVEIAGPDDFSESFSFSSLNGTQFEVRSADRVGALVSAADLAVEFDNNAQTLTVTFPTGGKFETGFTGEVKVWYKTDMEFTENIPEMRITIGNIPVAVKTRKLKAMWSQESEQDLKAYHGLSADAELTALVSNEMIAEIDREIIQKCMTIVPQSSRFTYDWNSFAQNNTSGNYLDAHLALMQRVTRASNEVFRKSKIGPANWMIVGTKVASYIEVLKGFIPNPVTASMGMNIVKAGTYAGRYDIYKDPMFPDDKILMGHKSPQSPFGAGLVYSPYVTNLTPVIVGENDFNPRRGFLARYGLTQVPHGQLLYSMITIKDLP